MTTGGGRSPEEDFHHFFRNSFNNDRRRRNVARITFRNFKKRRPRQPRHRHQPLQHHQYKARHHKTNYSYGNIRFGITKPIIPWEIQGLASQNQLFPRKYKVWHRKTNYSQGNTMICSKNHCFYKLKPKKNKEKAKKHYTEAKKPQKPKFQDLRPKAGR